MGLVWGRKRQNVRRPVDDISSARDGWRRGWPVEIRAREAVQGLSGHRPEKNRGTEQLARHGPVVASEIVLKRGIEREPDIIASTSAPNDPISVLLPFGSHGEYRQIVVGIDDAVLDLFLQIWYAPARSPLVAHRVSLCRSLTRCGRCRRSSHACEGQSSHQRV